MDVQLTEDQTLLRDGVREFLQRECPIQRIRAIAEGGHDEAEALWAGVAELGWPGLTLPAEYGGTGLDLVDLAVVFEETGAALFPSLLFSTVALGAPCVLFAGSPQQKSEILPAIATGSLRVTLAQLEESNGWGTEHLGWLAERSPDGFLLNGRKQHVLDAATSDLLVVIVRTQAGSEGCDGLSLLLVSSDSPGI
ncbi:MAG: acyl-CoA dehydrogenase family protein, partial [Myxococcota bacterium]